MSKKLSGMFRDFAKEKETKITTPSTSPIVSQKKSSSGPKILSSKKELHILTEENLILFIKQTNETKKYEMKHRFYDATALEISNLVEKLIKEGKLKRNRMGWISLKKVE